LPKVRQRHVPSSTAGPPEHVGIVCLARHTFVMPAAMLGETAMLDETPA
jgi:hypothetical protein